MRILRLTARAAMLAAALAISGCWPSHLPRAVRIESGERLGVVFPSLCTYSTELPPGGGQGLLLRDDDLLPGDSFAIRYFASDGPLLRVTASRGCVRVAGRVVTVFPAADSGLSWLEHASRDDLAHVRMLCLGDTLDPRALPAMTRLADVNPGVGLAAESQRALEYALSHFRPRVLMLTNFTADLRANRAGLEQLETLVLASPDSASLHALGELPRLRRLALSDWSLARTGPLPAGMTGLKSLVVSGGAGAGDPFRALPEGLEELSVVLEADSVNLSCLDRLPNLRTLVLTGLERAADPAGYAALPKLEWIGLPGKTTPAQLAAVVSAHPGLRVVEMIHTDQLTDLSPLRGLARLEGVVVGGKKPDLSALRKLHSLRFVGMACDSGPASRAELAALRNALPDALVVPIAPYCLGSGWLLLLLPLAGLAAWMAASMRGKREARARGE